MNKTRQEIISLIWDYMDKTLSFWCIIKMFDGNNETDYWIYICVDEHFLYQDNPEWSLFEPEKDSDYKIIWHYDITAVLKYIESKADYTRTSQKWIITILKDKLHMFINWYDIFLSKKPLHLYTESEEKDLLNLLIKLKE